MNSRLSKDGFTLVEILVAVALISAILSMVYGSYFAASKSARLCKAKIAMFQQGHKTLEQMARQIRCSYAGTAKKSPYPVRSTFRQRKAEHEKTINYFYGKPDDPSGEILHLVTTSRFFRGQEPADGLFEVAYQFDKSRGLLSLSHERFIGSSKKIVEKRNWRPIAENINSLELAFFDGQQWLRNWDFKEKKKLPSAVNIEISCEDENHRQYHYGTIAYVCSRKNQGKKTQTETLVSVNKQ